jgi:CHAD domain-containing protein
MSAEARAAESRRLLRDALCAMVAQAARWHKSPSEESLHDFRISLRRCRGLLRVLRDEFPERDIQPLRLALARAAGSLGEVRDLDVMLELIAEVDHHHKPPGKTDVLVRAIQRQRMARYNRAVRLFSGPSWTRIQARIDRLLLSSVKRSARAGGHSMDELADREFRRLKRSVERVEALAEAHDAESLHNFRTRLRRLRYFGRIMADYVPKRRRRKIKRIRNCEQQLGRVHDVDVALAWVARHSRSSPAWLPAILMDLRTRRHDHFVKMWQKKRVLAGF